MSEIREYEMILKVRKLLDAYFDIERGDDLDEEWTDRCYEIADAIKTLDTYLEEKK